MRLTPRTQGQASLLALFATTWRLKKPVNSAGRLGQARRISQRYSAELGMLTPLERMAALQEKAEAQPVRASAYPNGLTQREIEVIQLVAAGKMARETGEELGNTGGKNVRNIFSKTDSANRTEAAACAVRQGLMPEDRSDDI